MDITELARLAAETGQKLIEHGADASPELRKFQGEIEAFQYNQSSAANIRFLSFFLFSLIEDFYYNLTGDFPYQKSNYNIRDNIYKNIGQGLKEFAENLESDDLALWYKSCVKIVDTYLNGIAELNKTSNKAEDQ